MKNALFLAPITLLACGGSTVTEPGDVVPPPPGGSVASFSPRSKTGDPLLFDSKLCGTPIGPATGTSAGDFELHCTGLNYYQGSIGFASSLSKVITSPTSEVDNSAPPVCSVLSTGQLPPLGKIGSASLLAGINGQGPGASMVAYHGGNTWAALEACLKLDAFDQGRAIGAYEGIFAEKNAMNVATGRFARFHGYVDWCQYTKRKDCNHSFYDEAALMRLKQFTLESPLMSGRGAASDCRLLVDRNTTGAQLDLQMAYIDGQAISQLGTANCGGSIAQAATENRITFRIAKVMGPGTYGPEAPVEVSGYEVPGLEFFIPERWKLADLVSCVSDPAAELRLKNRSTSSCKMTYSDGTPGQVEIECDDTSFPMGRFTPGMSGNFKLTTQCDVRYRN